MREQRTDPGDDAEVVVAVLAGGSGGRIGGDKALARLCGEPLISYPLAASRKAGLPTIVVCKPATRLPKLDVPIVYEPEEPSHPLCGILAASRYARAPVLAVGCDMPFLAPALLAALAARPAGTRAIEIAGRLQPLPGLYPPDSTHTLEAALADRRSLRSTLALLEPEVLAEARAAVFGDPARMCFSVNRPEDLRQAQGWLSR